MATQYDDSSIRMLIGADRVRKKPASMLGSSKLAGARHTFNEIYGNALDEVSSGYGDSLNVTYCEDSSIIVRDFGRGVPLGWNNNPEADNWNWHNIYNEMYGGGKYEQNQKRLAQIVDWSKFDERDFNYLYSVGLNGLGASATQYASEFFEVRSYRDGECKSRSFKHGLPLVDGKPFDMFTATKDQIKKIPEEVCQTDEKNGTYIHWKPDIEVFDEVEVGGDWLFSTCEDIADVAGVTLNFKDEQTGDEKHIPAGNLADLAKRRSEASGTTVKNENGETVVFSNKGFSHGNIKVENKDFIYVCKCEIAYSLLESGSPKNRCFHNSVFMNTGIQYVGVRSAIEEFITRIAKQRGVKVDSKDYSDVFAVYVSSYSNYASVRGQTKDGVDDTFILDIIKKTLLDSLSVEYGKGNSAIVNAVEHIIEAAERRIADAIFLKQRNSIDKLKREKSPEKLASCKEYENKDYSRTELWITEGDSAKESVVSARDYLFQAVYPIRGKGLNVLKCSIKRVLENKEIREIFALLGTGIDINSRKEKTFNINDLKFDKIIFATDADEDGYQIRVLLFLTFYRLAPELLRQGRVYIAETPRFRVDFSDGTYEYALDDIARDKIISANSGRISKISRYKGLGEVDANVLRESTVAPESRKLVQLSCDLTNEFERELIDALFGADKYKQRKSIITSVLGMEVDDLVEENALLLSQLTENEDSDEDEESALA